MQVLSTHTRTTTWRSTFALHRGRGRGQEGTKVRLLLPGAKPGQIRAAPNSGKCCWVP